MKSRGVRQFLTVFTTLFFACSILFSQDQSSYRTVSSLVDWVREVNQWPDENYEQEYLRIVIDPEKDKDHFLKERGQLNDLSKEIKEPLRIQKTINIVHVIFDIPFEELNDDYYFGVNIGNLVFERDALFYNIKNGRLGFYNTTFERLLQIRRSETMWWHRFKNCQFNYVVNINNPYANTPYEFAHCRFQGSLILNSEEYSPNIEIDECLIQGSVLLTATAASGYEFVKIRDSKIYGGISFSDSKVSNSLEIVDTEFSYLDLEGADLPSFNSYIPFGLVSGKLRTGLFGYANPFNRNLDNRSMSPLIADSLSQREYDEIIAGYSKLLDIYQNRSDRESYNACYIEMKNLMTGRLQMEYKANPGFGSYFDYQINVFLRIFSDYGTRPAKAIIFSLYVILFFGFIYFFFPNSWDSHGKQRIMDRYSFFIKYLIHSAGIHEVYMEEKRQELLSFSEFKNLVENSKNKVPKFFIATAIPLYKWSIAGTKLSAKALGMIDVLDGTWNDLPKRKRMWKSLLIIGAFMTAVVYDLMIKMMNALMLSVNTFTTLGFGEIPISGFPRYLAIIQGFIGWFMLTIFSVSLISQILNQ